MDVLFNLENDLFTQVLEDVLSNLFESNHISDLKTVDCYSITKVKEEVKNFIFETNLNVTGVAEWLSTKNINDRDNMQTFISMLEENKNRLLYLTLIHHYCQFGEIINTFDWKLKLICGSSELKTLSCPLLQLVLHTIDVNHKPRERLYEMNKDTLLRLIGALEKIVDEDDTNLNE